MMMMRMMKKTTEVNIQYKKRKRLWWSAEKMVTFAPFAVADLLQVAEVNILFLFSNKTMGTSISSQTYTSTTC